MSPKISILTFVIVLFVCVVAGNRVSHAAGPDSEKAKEIKKELEEARFFKSLLDTKAVINSNTEGRCGKWIGKAREFRRALKKLNAQYKDRYDTAYQKKFQELKKQNSLAFKDYENCFASNLRQYPAITQKYIYAYPAFRARVKRYDKQFEKVANLDTHIAELEEKLKHAKQGDVVASLASFSGWVRIFPRHSKHFAAKSDHKFLINDRVRTGPNGSARIVFTSEYANGGSAVMNVGPDTEVIMGKYWAYTNDLTPKTPVLDLIGGAVRVLFSPFKKKKDGGFHIRTSSTLASAGRSGGTSLVLRGTEGSLSHDRKTGVTKVSLSHGDAYVESGGRKATLKPGTTRTVSGGRISAPKTLSRTQWNRIVAATGAGKQEKGASAKFGTGPVRGRTGQRRSDKQVASLSAPDTPLAKLTRSYAKSVVQNLFFAIRANDASTVLNLTTGDFNKSLRDGLKKKSFKQLIDEAGNRPLSEKFRCTLCNHRKGSCQLLVDMRVKSGRGRRISTGLFSVKTVGRDGGFKVFDAKPAEQSGIRAFMKKAPICDVK